MKKAEDALPRQNERNVLSGGGGIVGQQQRTTAGVSLPGGVLPSAPPSLKEKGETLVDRLRAEQQENKLTQPGSSSIGLPGGKKGGQGNQLPRG